MDTSIIEYYRTINNSNNLSKSEMELNSAKNFVLSGFDSCGKYAKCKVNGTDRELLIYGSSNGLIANVEMNFITKPNEYILVGDIVSWSNSDWLVIKLDADDSIFCQGRIQQCINTLKLYDENAVLSQIPCVITDKLSMSTDENKFITTLSDEMYILVPHNETTKLIKIGDVYNIGKWNWQVSGINDVAQVGILRLKVEITTEEPVIIPDPTPLPFGLSAEIIGEASIVKGSSKTYIAKFYDSGVILDESAIFYLVGDDGVSITTLASIVSQDTNGNCTIVAGNQLGYIKLLVRNTDSSIVSNPLRITIKNIFG